MTDARLRELERRAGDDPAARVAWLAELQRAGGEGADRVRLAAALGEEGAAQALGGPPALRTDEPPPSIEAARGRSARAIVLRAPRAVVLARAEPRVEPHPARLALAEAVGALRRLAPAVRIEARLLGLTATPQPGPEREEVRHATRWIEERLGREEPLEDLVPWEGLYLWLERGVLTHHEAAAGATPRSLLARTVEAFRLELRAPS